MNPIRSLIRTRTLTSLVLRTLSRPPAASAAMTAATSVRASISTTSVTLSTSLSSDPTSVGEPRRMSKRRAASKRKTRHDEGDEMEEEAEKVSEAEADSKVELTQQETPARKSDSSATTDTPPPPPPTAAPAAKRRRRTAKDDKAETDKPPPLAPRTTASSFGKEILIGAHVSASGGVHNTIPNALHIGANAFALFLRSQRKWSSPPLDPAARRSFRVLGELHGYDPAAHMLPHGSYLVNLAQPDAAKAALAYACFVDDLRRCAQLGIRLYNFHPGSAVDGSTKEEAVRRIAAHLNAAHRETAAGADDDGPGGDDGPGVPGGVVTVLENMAGSGNVVGSRFEELRDIIALVDDKDRVGVCIDTCHAFAAGYDMRTQDAFDRTMREFDEIVGLKYLKALHLNDSKAPLGSRRDLHANIGTGFLGLRAFHAVVNYAPFAGMPMVLETPIDRVVGAADGKRKATTVENYQIWADEIKLLEGLVGADPDTDEFRVTAERLQEQGREERDKIAAQVEKKMKKMRTGKGKKTAEDGCESCDDTE